MDMLRLVALDEEDLQILSAHLQDAVMKVADLDYQPQQKRFALAGNRFVWELPDKRGFRKHSFQRRRSALHFNRVNTIKATGIDRNKKDDVLSLLSIRFVAADAPAGTIELTFSGNAAIRLNVECIEAQLTDLGPAWETNARPRHTV